MHHTNMIGTHMRGRQGGGDAESQRGRDTREEGRHKCVGGGRVWRGFKDK